MALRKFIRVTLLLLAGLLILAAAVWMWSRLQGPSPAQREAMALLQPSPLPEGRNAFDALWLLARDVPESGLRQVVTADMRRIRAELARSVDAVPSGPEHGAAARYRDLRPGVADMKLFCPHRGDCLQRVRADPGGYAALVERHRLLLDRVAALSGHDFYRSRLPLDVRAPLPQFTLARLGLTEAAQRYVSGDVDGGLARACTGLRTWRRLGAHSDSLIVRMLGVALATDGYGRLLAQMLAELPGDHPLPPACDAALAPVALQELSICEAMRGEYAANVAATDVVRYRETGSVVDAMFGRLVYDPRQTRALMAEDRVRACSEKAQSLLAADRQLNWQEVPRSPWRMACAANLAGCILADIAAPAYVGYAWRAQDGGARLDLLRGVVSLHGGSGDGRAQEAALRRFWAATRGSDRELRFVDGGRAVEVREFDGARGGWWQLPLPAAPIAQGN